MTVIDFHSHFVPERFPDRPAGLAEPAWPRMEPLADGSGATMFVGDGRFRDFGAYYWDVPGRLATMDANGIDIQVISPLPELFSYWLAPRAGAALTDAMNRACAEAVSRGGGRLKGMGILALQDIPHAVGQVRAIAGLGLSGIFMGSHVNGKSIASEDFHPVLAEAEKAGLPLFIHGVRPGLLERIEGPALMAAVVGIPYEGTMALAGFMATDIFARFPALEIVFAHGGGMIGAVIDRMELVWRTFPAMQANLKEPPTHYARRFWYDSVVFAPEALAYVAGRVGADRMIAGTDGPTEIGQTDLPGFVAAAGFSETDRNAILGGNAARLLGL